MRRHTFIQFGIVSVSLVVLAAAFANAQFGSREREGVTAVLESELRAETPVPLNGPFPDLLRTAEVGDCVLLQVSYESRPIYPTKVTASFCNRNMKALEVLNAQHQVVLQKDGKQDAGTSGSHLAVLAKAIRLGRCSGRVTCEMSDGSTKSAYFQFDIRASSKGARNEPELGKAKYSAQQVSGEVIVFANGVHPTAGYETYLDTLPGANTFPPQFKLTRLQSAGTMAPAVAPFSLYTSFPAKDTIQEVVVHDANGEHKVKVEQVSVPK